MKINIENLSKNYKEKSVLKIEKHSFESGKITGIIGPNGAGKSTLLKIMAGLENNSRGTVYYDNEKISTKIMKEITYMGQQAYLFNMSVFDNIAYPLKIRKYNNRDINKKVNKIMKELDLYKLKDQLATKLSGGEAQKVALARAVVFDPKLLLLDEPTSNINPDSLELIENMIKRRTKSESMTTLIVSHNHEQTDRLCDEIVTICNGKISTNCFC